MKDKLEEILFMLKQEFKLRQDLITDNCKDIESTPLDEDSIEFKIELDELNKELRKRNDGNIELQNAIDKYIKLAYLPTEINKSISYEECLQMTIVGDIDYNVRNPFFFDDDFYTELLEYFIEREDYIKCSLIKRRRSKLFL